MQFAYADPPYLGCAKKFYGDPTFDSLESHRALFDRLRADYPDGWAVSCSSTNLYDLLPLAGRAARVGAWVKPFAIFKPNVHPAYAWEPVIFTGGRRRSRSERTPRDWHSENITLRRGLTGAKPPHFGLWLLALLNVRFDLGDTIDDLFPGTGAVALSWQSYETPVPRCPTTT